ncbi:putative enoyl-CoA hydratase/isomerase, ClpP/crotonase-like domain superfamily [Helianthus annuus]|uniref:Delta(3)-Delta(2)-enoyl-CoA isomerase n=1 Tax=Helianthus annuus TaxID=4232 RepID=A0A9K3NTY8_HELAN|nr:putative enoyl-CoA hydratase/isomerase, ClpP/crotonase-like domain superfamily [Helianthus annuus]
MKFGYIYSNLNKPLLNLYILCSASFHKTNKLRMCSLEKRGNLFLLTLTGDGVDEHRLNSTLISSIRSALSDASLHSTHGSVLLTIAQGKFFCNGFDFNTTDTIFQLINQVKCMVAEFISLPMPTIVVITGHAIGAGLGLALCHDYVYMRRDHGLLSMNEIHKGLMLPDYGVELIRAKVVKRESLRDVLLRGVKVKADEAVMMGLVDIAYEDRESAVEGGLRMGEELAKMKWNGKLYAQMRKALYPELCSVLGLGFKPKL